MAAHEENRLAKILYGGLVPIGLDDDDDDGASPEEARTRAREQFNEPMQLPRHSESPCDRFFPLLLPSMRYCEHCGWHIYKHAPEAADDLARTAALVAGMGGVVEEALGVSPMASEPATGGDALIAEARRSSAKATEVLPLALADQVYELKCAVSALCNLAEERGREIERLGKEAREAEQKLAELEAQDIDETHTLLSSAGVDAGALSERVEDLIDQYAERKKEIERLNRNLGEAGEQYGIALFEIEKLATEVKRLSNPNLLKNLEEWDILPGGTYEPAFMARMGAISASLGEYQRLKEERAKERPALEKELEQLRGDVQHARAETEAARREASSAANDAGAARLYWQAALKTLLLALRDEEWLKNHRAQYGEAGALLATSEHVAKELVRLQGIEDAAKAWCAAEAGSYAEREAATLLIERVKGEPW